MVKMENENKFIAVFHHARHDEWWKEGDCRLIHLMTPELLAERGLTTSSSMDLVELEALDIPTARIAANEILSILCKQRIGGEILGESKNSLDNLAENCNDDLSEISNLREDEEMVKENKSDEMTEKIVSIRKGKGGKPAKFLHMKEAEGFDPDDYSEEVVHVNVGKVESLEEAKTIAWPAFLELTGEKQDVDMPRLGALVVTDDMEAALKGGKGGMDVEDLILQFLQQNPASAKRLAKRATEPIQEPEIKVHFEMGEITVGKFGKRKKVFVTSSLKRAPAKIGLSTFMTILNNPEEAKKFAHENGLEERARGGEEDEDENGVDVVQSARTSSLPARGRILQAK